MHRDVPRDRVGLPQPGESRTHRVRRYCGEPEYHALRCTGCSSASRWAGSLPVAMSAPE